MRGTERAIQAVIFFSRWLLAPFFVGLLGCIFLLLYRFFADLYALAKHLPAAGWHELVVGVLNLVDVALTANLVLIVIFSGYENFIRKVEPREHPGWPEGLVEIDFNALKQKILGSIAVIAAVDALAWYLDLEKYTDTSKLAWAIGFPLTFVVSMLLLSVSDRLSRRPNSTSR